MMGVVVEIKPYLDKRPVQDRASELAARLERVVRKIAVEAGKRIERSEKGLIDV